MSSPKEAWQIPGLFIRDLLYAIPGAQLSPAEAHYLYRQRVREANERRPKALRLHGRRYHATQRYFVLLEDAGAIRRVGTRPRSPVTHLGNPRPLVLIRPPGVPRAPAVQVLYAAVLPENAWQWVNPWARLPGPPAPPREAPAPVGVPPAKPKEPEAWPVPAKAKARFALSKQPNAAGVKKLYAYLRALATLDPEAKEVSDELERLADDLDSWISSLEEAKSKEEDKEVPNDDRLDRFQDQLDALEDMVTSLEGQDASSAIAKLDEAFPEPSAQVRKVAKLKVTALDRLQAKAKKLVPRVEALREQKNQGALAKLDNDISALSNNVIDAEARERSPAVKQGLEALDKRLGVASLALEEAKKALTRRAGVAYLRALTKTAQALTGS